MYELPEIVIQNVAQPTALTTARERSIWDDFLALQISPATQRTYARSISDFSQRVYSMPASAQSIAQFLQLPQSDALFTILDYRRQLIDPGLSPSTINGRLAAIKSLVNYARKMGAATISLDDIPSIRSQAYKDTSGVDVAQYRQILAMPDRSTAIGVRDYALLRLFWDNVLRRKEIAGLNVGDFDRGGQKIHIVGKGQLEKIPIEITRGTTVAIVDWLGMGKTGDARDPLFVSLSHNQPGHRLSGSSLYSIVRDYSAAAGIEKVMSPHRVRHSGITAALDATDGDTRRVQRLSRHADLNTLTRYDDNRHRHQGEITTILGDLLDAIE
jgi:integrase/recombinase XerC